MTPAPHLLRLWILGPWRAQLGDGRTLRPATRHARILLARLALDHPQPISKGVLIQDLFPGLPPESGLRRLRATRHYLRQELGDLLVVDDQFAGLAPDLQIQCDYLEFLQRTAPGASRADLEAAVALYRGGMFQPPPEGWATELAHATHLRYIQTLRSLVALARTLDSPAASLSATQLWVAEEPWEEQAHVAHLEALIASDNLAAAQVHLTAARALLRSEWRSQAHDALAELARVVGRLRPERGVQRIPAPLQRVGPAPDLAAEALIADPDRFPLVGRSAELAALQNLWADVLAAQPRGLIIEGASGIGKTRLASELMRQARLRAPHAVLWCAAGAAYSDCWRAIERGFTQLAPAPQATVARLCAGLDALTWAVICRHMPRLRRLLPDRQPDPLPLLPPAGEAARRVDALCRLLDSLAAQGALLLVIDDLPQVDAELYVIFRRLLRGRRRIGVIVTAQPGRCGELDLDDDGQALFGSMLVEPLDEAHTRVLLSEALGPAIDPALLAQLARLSGGSPGFILSALRSLIQQDALQYDPRQGWRLSPPDLSLPVHVGELLASRLARVSDDARDLAELLAVLGRPVGHLLLAALWGDEERRLSAQAELLRNAVLVERGDDLRFEHPWLQASLLQQLSPERLVVLHARIADALSGLSEAGGEEQARHAAGAQRWDEALLMALELAEQALAESRPALLERALMIAEQALDALSIPELDMRRWGLVRMRERYHASLLRAPAWEQDLALMRALAEAAGRADWQAEALHRWGLERLAQGSPTEARGLLAEAAELARAHGLADLETWVRLALADALDMSDEVDQALSECLIAAKISCALEAPELHLRVLMRLGQGYARTGQITAAVALLDGLQQHPLLLQRPLLAARHAYHLGLTLIRARAVIRGLAALRICLQHAYAVGDIYWKLRGQVALSQILIQLGMYSDGITLAEAALALARQVGDERVGSELIQSLAVARYNLGEIEQSHSLAGAGANQLAPHGGKALLAAHCCLGARAALALGRTGEAQELLARTELYLGVHAPPEQLAGAASIALALGAAGRARCYALLAVERAQSPGESTPLAAGALWEAAEVIVAVDGRAAAQPIVEQGVAYLLDDLALLDTPELRRAFVTADSPRRALAALAERGPVRRLVWLPLCGAPTGRPLHADELQPIVWTLHAESDPSELLACRQQQVRRLADEALAQGSVATVEALAAALAVTPRTIKRDLKALRAVGTAVTTRGALLGTGYKPI